MNFLQTKKFTLFASALLGVLILADVYFLLIWKPPGAAASAQAEPDAYEIRSRLLMDATDSVGSCTPESAATTWAEGLKGRSAALQYAVMTQALKMKYAAQLEKTFPNWVTGVSSPWVESYAVTRNEIDSGNWCFHIRFSTKTSAGAAGDYDAVLIVAKEGEFWRVAEVVTEPELNLYTGFLH